MPVFAAAGSGVPLAGGLAADAEQDRWRGVRIYAAPGEVVTETTIYDDDGVTLGWNALDGRETVVRVATDEKAVLVTARSRGRHRPAYDAIDVEIVDVASRSPRVVQTAGEVPLRLKA